MKNARRCYHCGGRFGLVRREGLYIVSATFGFAIVSRQFCTTKCKTSHNEQLAAKVRDGPERRSPHTHPS